jgi:hypothetical protein
MMVIEKDGCNRYQYKELNFNTFLRPEICEINYLCLKQQWHSFIPSLSSIKYLENQRGHSTCPLSINQFGVIITGTAPAKRKRARGEKSMERANAYFEKRRIEMEQRANKQQASRITSEMELGLFKTVLSFISTAGHTVPETIPVASPAGTNAVDLLLAMYQSALQKRQGGLLPSTSTESGNVSSTPFQTFGEPLQTMYADNTDEIASPGLEHWIGELAMLDKAGG